MAAVDYFLKIDGIDGEAIDRVHLKELVVDSFSWGLSQSGSFAAGSGGGSGKAQFQDFHFTTKTSKASPQLFLKCATGAHIKEATLSCRKAGGETSDFMHIKMQDVLISSFQQSGNGDLPIESISMVYCKLIFEYIPQKPDGTSDAPVTTGWDVRANRAV